MFMQIQIFMNKYLNGTCEKEDLFYLRIEWRSLFIENFT